MIIASLQGGLGNQLFQYAAGRALALERKTHLKLDISNFEKEGYPRRSYALSNFNIQENFATESEISKLKLHESLLTKNSPKFRKLLSFAKPTYVCELYSHGIIPQDRNNLYLDGNWQSEDYFKSNEKIIRQDFKIKAPPSKASLTWLKKITHGESIAVHVRRTDYVNRGGRKPIIGCSLDYYDRASKLLLSKLQKPNFFVFSDDLLWCKNNIFFPGFKTNYISGSEIEDLRLMSACAHNIVANSSFSWWGAWLNPNPKKIVIAPEPWLENSINRYHSYVPTSWLKIPKVQKLSGN